ncbi:MAG: hypothetical protein UV38_C0004G0010 [candidate division TM6 bacterium GW2011_GWE2_42_60]|nr:MAG: hypothetical protein UV38_C0004G0010 [candidate division TM6 bacterium GW2011_GWE2_42_60]HBY05888.1 hypothetical protein [Candidatus Dependentiae bacterium]
MNQLLTVTIVTPSGEKTFEAEWLEIETPSGNRVIKVGHAPMIAQLLPQSALKYLKPGGAIESSLITQGVVRVERALALVVADQP